MLEVLGAVVRAAHGKADAPCLCGCAGHVVGKPAVDRDCEAMRLVLDSEDQANAGAAHGLIRGRGNRDELFHELALDGPTDCHHIDVGAECHCHAKALRRGAQNPRKRCAGIRNSVAAAVSSIAALTGFIFIFGKKQCKSTLPMVPPTRHSAV